MHTTPAQRRGPCPIIVKEGGRSGSMSSVDADARHQRMLLRSTASDLNDIAVKMLHLRGERSGRRTTTGPASNVATQAGESDDGHDENRDGDDDDEEALRMFQGAFAALVATMPQGGDGDGGETVEDGPPSSASPQSAGAAIVSPAGSREEAIRRGAEQINLGREWIVAAEARAATSSSHGTSAGTPPPPSHRQSPSCVSSSPEDVMETDEDGKRRRQRDEQGNGGADGAERMPRTRLLSSPIRIEPHPPPKKNEGGCGCALVEEDYVRDRHNLAAIVYNMGLVYCRREAYHTAEQLFEMALETAPDPDAERGNRANATARTGTEFFTVAYLSLNNLGHIRFCLGRHEEATKHFSDALRLVQKVCEDLEMHQVGMGDEGVVEKRDHDPSSAQKPKEAMDTCHSSSPERCHAVRRHLSAIMTNNALTLFAVGEAAEQRGMLDAAMLVYVGIVKARRAQPLPGLPEDPCASMVYSLVLFRMGNIHYLKGDKDRAVQAFEFALTLRREALGHDHEVVAALVHDLGVVQLELGRNAEAMECFAECLRIRRALHGNDHREVAEVLYRIGRVRQDVGNYREALDAYEDAVRIERATLGPDHPDVAITVTNIGQIHYLLGDLGPALEAYGEVLRIVRRTMGESHPSIVEIQSTIGTIHLNLGNSRDAVTAFEEARRVERESSAAGLRPRSGETGNPSMDLDSDDDEPGHDRPNFPGASAA